MPLSHPIPKTLLSIIHHGTIHATQAEMHTNPDAAFQRYGITDPTSRKLCLALDAISGPLRENPNDAQIRLDFESAAKDLYEHLKLVLNKEIARGVPVQASLNVGPDARLLTALAKLMYLQSSRNDPLPALKDPAPVGAEQADVQAAWDAVKAALKNNTPVAAQHTDVLCDRMQKEFLFDVWEFIW